MLFLTVSSSSDYGRSGYDHYGGYDRGGRGGYDRGGRGGNDRGGRGGYADDRSYGRFGNRSAAGYQNGISGKLVDANYFGFSFFPSLYFMHDKALILVFRHYISSMTKH
jgi:hypothetical protein